MSYSMTFSIKDCYATYFKTTFFPGMPYTYLIIATY